MSEKLVPLEVFLQLPRSQQQLLTRAQAAFRQIELEKARQEKAQQKARSKRSGVNDE